MKLLFRKINEDDLSMILEWRTNPEISQYMYTDFNPDMDKQRQWFENISRDSTRKHWIVNVDGYDFGLVWLFEIDKTNNRCLWGLYIGSSTHHNKGIGTTIILNLLKYAFDELKLNKISGEPFGFNEKSISIHRKVGFKEEGIRREHILKNNTYFDIVDFGITKTDWDQGNSSICDFPIGEFEQV